MRSSISTYPPARICCGAYRPAKYRFEGLEAAVQKVVDPHLLAYNDTWDKVDAMLAKLMSESFRTHIPDSAGKGWIYNWFCVDHVDYDLNPRRRDIGYHNIFEHYSPQIRETGSTQDGLHFHYHPHSFRREAHRSRHALVGVVQ